ncbi:carboxypeptidase-like regulatory domain-containing protein [Mucilaginibacter litoreus]|uniref:Carboxypeptidase-like regulatory domain-containing protein n=1 Tax=Mucilaginibacter litoreus TaxID=1048221 RepID=A0ABW3ASX7_9SPHI
MRCLFLTLLLFPVVCLAQINITGKLIDAKSRQPVADASIFLSNATVGGKSGADGSFKLLNVRPGQYELVVTVLGYATYRQNVLAGSDNMHLADIMLTAKTTELKEVKIQPHDNWLRNYKLFKDEFLGLSNNAKECRILNPDAVYLTYSSKYRTLTGSSDEFLEIENRALGYKIKYLINKFTRDYKEGYFYVEGSALFEPMAGDDGLQKRWRKNRAKVYEGSSMHFLRSIVTDQAEVNGFKVLRLIRKENPMYSGTGNNKYIQTLIDSPLQSNEFAKLTDVRGLFALSFPNSLYIMYTKRKTKQPAIGVYHPDKIPNYEITIVTVSENYGLFDTNGIILNPSGVTFEGEWGKNRVA